MPLKFNNPSTIRATYRIVTPMFIGDAEQKATGISPSSVKGALRFWWRALNWGRFRADSDDEQALKRLHEAEGALFGSSADNGRAASFTLRLNTSEIQPSKKDWPNGRPNDASSYLGLGLWQMGDQKQRDYQKENQSFSVIITTKHDISAGIKKQLSDALLAWGLLGGLGARARRAFGSVAINSIDGSSYTFPQVEDYQKAVSELLSEYRDQSISRPPFSALSKETRFSISRQAESQPRFVHAALGNAFKNYRGQPSSMRGSKKRVFGLPYSGGTHLEGDARRSSPLMMHVHPIENKFVMAALFMPATFHHHEELLSVDYSLADNFLGVLPEAVIL